ncbi:MAG: DsrE family protein [Thiotrichaceae bacterium]|nr:DsrE family protein [Thiotrichaceae bacterium]
MKSWLIFLCALCVSPLSFADVGERYSPQKVVYQINNGDVKQQDAALRNIQNHMNAVGVDKIEVIVVLFGDGVDLLKRAQKDMDLQARILGLKEHKVKFDICKNTLTARKIDYQSDLFDAKAEDIVPSGSAEIAHLQQHGYIYMRP